MVQNLRMAAALTRMPNCGRSRSRNVRTNPNAVAAWVARVDRAAVRTTHNVDILLRRSDFEAATVALETVGFHHHEVMGVSCFIDGIGGSPRDAVHLLFAGEKVRAA